LKVIDRAKAVAQHFLEESFKKVEVKIKEQNILSECLLVIGVLRVFVFCVVRVGFCTGHFVMVPFTFTYLHCLQHSPFEHLFHFYYECTTVISVHVSLCWHVYLSVFSLYFEHFYLRIFIVLLLK